MGYHAVDDGYRWVVYNGDLLLRLEQVRDAEGRRARDVARRGARAPDRSWLRRSTGGAPSQQPRRGRRGAPGGGASRRRELSSFLSIPAQTARAHGTGSRAARSGSWRNTYYGKLIFITLNLQKLIKTYIVSKVPFII